LEKCDKNILSYINNQTWKINCSNIDYECKYFKDYTLIKGEGCNEVLLLSLMNDNMKLAEENSVWLNNLFNNRIDDFKSNCTNINITKINPANVGNRSVSYEVIDEKTIKYSMKIMKRLEGDNIEDEILKYLTQKRLTNIPKYVCNIKYKNYLYGLLTEYIEGIPAATYYINSSIDFLKYGRFKSIGSLIGKNLAILHKALSECQNKQCNKEVINDDTIEKWLYRILWRSKYLRNNIDSFNKEDRNLLMETIDSIDELLEINKSNIKNFIGKTVMRIHGDLHLYQIIMNENNIYFTDFEGEPYKYPSNKLEKEMIERDLAALTRSINYASIMALQLLNEVNLKDAINLYDSKSLIWERDSANDIINSYLKSLPDSLIENLDDFNISLSFWVFERATYEVLYELIARTGYHYIPMNALIRMKEGKDPYYKI
jgi:maltose alpha-D-glucosyltransferase/alpha-amylase